ncbi:hypothetical protein [Nocardia sp. XZ_19_385]|uniref:hypothetical protein n=1 Tax=Nocardia sp. XZ_19_385 TaxID=2769488 RepID=UPI00188F21C8|nr:hypothetical protein [Nocardia sp. XZ_19_385]
MADIALPNEKAAQRFFLKLSGACAVVGGIATYLAWHSSAGFVAALAFNAASTIWPAIMGILMLRRARAVKPAAPQ